MGVAIPLLIGKQNLFRCYKIGIHPFAATAFTNAVAYPYTKLEFVASILEEHASETAVDLLLDSIADYYKLHRYLVVPNLFQHIGVFSSNILKNQGFDYHLKTSLSFEE